MRTSFKIIAGLAVAGLAALGGTASTASGLTKGTGVVDQFIGGTVSQGITGATLDSIAYTYVGGETGPKTHIASIISTFSATQQGHTVTVTTTGGSEVFTCVTLASPWLVSTCNSATAAGSGGVTDVFVTVA